MKTILIKIVLLTIVFSSAEVIAQQNRNLCPHGYPEFESVIQDETEKYEVQTLSSVPYFESLPGADAVIFIDFDGHSENHSFFGSITAGPKTYNNVNRYTDIAEIVSEHFRPFAINITTDSTVYLAASPNRRQRVVVTADDVVGGSGMAQGWSFSDPNGASCYVETSGKNKTDVANTVSHEVGHTFGLIHDGDASNGTQNAYYNSSEWTPIMGSTNPIGRTQWNNGDYLDANNPEDDIAIINEAPNNVAFREDDHGSTINSGTELNINGAGNLNGNDGIIEKRSDVDVWYFKTSGGNSTINVVSFSTYAVLEPGAELINLDDNSVYQFTLNADFEAVFSGNLTAGNYVLSISAGRYFTADNYGPTNYGSLGSYEIDGAIPGELNFDYVSTPFGLNILSPSSNQMSLTPEDTSFVNFSFEVFGQNNPTLEFMVDGTEYTLQQNGSVYSCTIPYYLTRTQNFDISMTQNGEQVDTSFEFTVLQNKVVPIGASHLSLLDFSSEMPADNPYKIATALASYCIDGDTSSIWANGLGDLGWDPFPHWVEIEFDSVYDLAAINIAGAENIGVALPEDVKFYFDRDGDGNWDEIFTTSYTFGTYFSSYFPSEYGSENLVKKMKFEILNSFGEFAYFNLAEIIPYKRIPDVVTSSNEDLIQSNGVVLLKESNGVFRFKYENSTSDKLSINAFSIEGKLIQNKTILVSNKGEFDLDFSNISNNMIICSFLFEGEQNVYHQKVVKK